MQNSLKWNGRLESSQVTMKSDRHQANETPSWSYNVIMEHENGR
jgi:hypothetical protein